MNDVLTYLDNEEDTELNETLQMLEVPIINMFIKKMSGKFELQQIENGIKITLSCPQLAILPGKQTK